jgi:hypothetical protein
MIRRLIILQIILLAGLGAVFLLPKTPEMKPAALNTELPNFLTLTGWFGQKHGKPSIKEEQILAKDTQFFRRDYRRVVSDSDQLAMAPPGKETRIYRNIVDVLNAGIVLSGKDLSSSIHAQERCLTAQGFNIPHASTMHVKLRSGHTLGVRRLVCEKPVEGTNNVARSISYYWFVGHDYVTSNHVSRGIKDFLDRVLRGYDQHWAYITITAQLDGSKLTEEVGPEKKIEDVKNEWGDTLLRRPLSEQKADELVQEFISDLGPDIIRVDEIKSWPEE